jgi:hypothetical protein
MIRRSPTLLSIPLVLSLLAPIGCSSPRPAPLRENGEDTMLRNVEHALTAERRLASKIPGVEGGYGEILKKTGLKPYFANLHAHHFMGAKDKRAANLADMLAPGDCKVGHAKFPEDDGRPCRDDGGRADQTIPPRSTLPDGSPDVVDYFRQACEYGTNEGRLDVLFVTPHTKNDQVDEQAPEASTQGAHLLERAALLGTLNPPQTAKDAKRYCGLGQEMSSISAGNHMNLFGQFRIGAKDPKAAFFHAGKFDELYPQIAKRLAAGEKLMVQMNHPDVRNDVRFGDLSETVALAAQEYPQTPKKTKFVPETPAPDESAEQASAREARDAAAKAASETEYKEAKEGADKLRKRIKAARDFVKNGFHDYGLDDYSPALSCKLGRLKGDACKGVSGSIVTPDDVRAGFAAIRKASGNPFRLIEVIGPSFGGVKEAPASDDDDANGDSEPPKDNGKFGATSNPHTGFRKVHDRKGPDTHEDDIYNWIFYLSMGMKLAPSANQDNHHMNWGSATSTRTGILAKDVRESSILSAIDARKTFATEDLNAKVLTYVETRAGSKVTAKGMMGDTVKTTARVARLYLAYDNENDSTLSENEADDDAQVRLYFYRAGDKLDFTGGITKAFRTVGWDKSRTETWKAVLPAVDAQGRAADDLIPIRRGMGVRIELPLEKGVQWVFAEVIQNGDHDKLWSAPIWIERR